MGLIVVPYGGVVRKLLNHVWMLQVGQGFVRPSGERMAVQTSRGGVVAVGRSSQIIHEAGDGCLFYAAKIPMDDGCFNWSL